jgi:hypothetical protein
MQSIVARPTPSSAASVLRSTRAGNALLVAPSGTSPAAALAMRRCLTMFADEIELRHFYYKAVARELTPHQFPRQRAGFPLFADTLAAARALQGGENRVSHLVRVLETAARGQGHPQAGAQPELISTCLRPAAGAEGLGQVLRAEADRLLAGEGQGDLRPALEPTVGRGHRSPLARPSPVARALARGHQRSRRPITVALPGWVRMLAREALGRLAPKLPERFAHDLARPSPGRALGRSLGPRFQQDGLLAPEPARLAVGHHHGAGPLPRPAGRRLARARAERRPERRRRTGHFAGQGVLAQRRLEAANLAAKCPGSLAGAGRRMAACGKDVVRVPACGLQTGAGGLGALELARKASQLVRELSPRAPLPGPGPREGRARPLRLRCQLPEALVQAGAAPLSPLGLRR